MPTVKQSVGIAIAIALAFSAATAFGQSASQVPTNGFTPSKADFRLNDHQRLRQLLGIERPLRQRRDARICTRHRRPASAHLGQPASAQIVAFSNTPGSAYRQD
jgi:hypothetical protein